MKRPLALLLGGIFLVSLHVSLSSGPAQAACAAGVRVQNAAKDFLRARKLGTRAALRRALMRHVDMRRVMNFALGRSMRRLKGAQRQQYYERANAYAVRQLAQLAKQVRGERVDVVRCNARRVVTRVLPQGEKVIWKLRGGRIVDVNFRGVWVAHMLRDRFRQMLRESNEDIQVFLARLH